MHIYFRSLAGQNLLFNKNIEKVKPSVRSLNILRPRRIKWIFQVNKDIMMV